MKKIVINGKDIYKKNARGVQRYTKEMVLFLDKYVSNIDIEILVKEKKEKLNLKNIKVIEYGKMMPFKGWQYIAYQYYLLKNNALGISFSTNRAPLFLPGIVAIHDIRFIKEKKEYDTMKKKLIYLYKLFINFLSVKMSKHIITVSEYSKKQIEKYYNCKENKISIVYNGWEHLKNIIVDNIYFENKYKEFLKKDFYFYIGGKEKHKNIKWIKEMAKKNNKALFIIAGPKVSIVDIKDDSNNVDNIRNLKTIGYITDEEMAFFMSKCKAFLFPSLYEGFGIPPLEALYFGARVLCSNSTCLPEIYKDYVTYFDPYDYDVDLDKLLEKPVNKSKEIFDLYSWDKSAKQLLNIIKQYQ